MQCSVGRTPRKNGTVVLQHYINLPFVDEDKNEMERWVEGEIFSFAWPHSQIFETTGVSAGQMRDMYEKFK